MWRRYLRFWGSDVRADVDTELEYHLQELTERLVEEGRTPAEARAEAGRRFGDYARIKAACVDIGQRWERQRRWRQLLADLGADIRYATRRLRVRPILAVVAVAVLALGIGANVAILALVDALLLRPVPGAEPHRLVALFTSDYSSGQPGGNSYPDFLDIQDSTRDVFENVTVASLPRQVGVRLGNETRVMSAQMVEPNYFDTMGLRPVHGRGFAAVETAAVAVISNALWLAEFGGDRSVLGRAIVINGSPFTVVGVAPVELASAQGIFRVDVRVPLAFEQLVRRDDVRRLGNVSRQELRAARGYSIVGRLREGVGIGDARTVLGVVARRLHQSYPADWTGLSGQPRALTVRETTRLPLFASGPVVGALAVLTGLVGTLLLIVCANISGLLLADASVRRREMSIRQALGATRWRLIRQVVVESLGLGLVGGCLGVAAASVAMSFVAVLLPEVPPFSLQLDLELSRRLLVAALVLSTGVGLAVGFLPALYATRPKPGLGSGVQTRFRNALTAMQATAAVFLLILAGVFARGIVSAYAVPLGYDADELVLVTVDLEVAGYSADRGRAYLRQVFEQAPGAGVSEAPFLSLQAQSRRSFEVDGYQPRPGEDMEVNANIVNPGYMRLMGVPFVRGRDLESGERNAVVVNRAFAQRFWSGQDALGRRLRRRTRPASSGPDSDADSTAPPWSTVVGVVDDGRFVSFREDAIPVVFQSIEDAYSPQVTFHIRGVAADAARRAIARVDPGVPVVAVATMSETVGTALLPARIAAFVSGLVGAVGLALACIGLFGTLSYVVAQRVPEIGLRIALGARPGQIIRLVAGGASVKLVAAGVVVGAGLGSGIAPVLQSQLSGAGGVDLVTLAGVAVCLALVASVAIGVPAARALKIAPAEVLRVVE